MDSDVVQYKVIITPNAMKQLDEIYDYIVKKLKAPVTGKRLSKNLRSEIESLASFPNRGCVVRTEIWADKGIRFLIVGNYDVYYRIVADMMEVYVLAVSYSRRDLLNIFGADSVNYGVSETINGEYGRMKKREL